jgi:RNA-directed DNA polymerase
LLANITLDPLDKELERRGHRFARYADDFLVMVVRSTAAGRVMASLTRFVEGRLKLVVNRTKSQAAPLKQCAFLGFQIGARGKPVWTAKVHARFKRRVREITRRNRGHRVQDVIDELRRYVVGWLNFFGISHTYTALLELEEWVRRRVRLYYWKQWKQPRTRRRHLLALGIPREEVHMARHGLSCCLSHPVISSSPRHEREHPPIPSNHACTRRSVRVPRSVGLELLLRSRHRDSLRAIGAL